MNWKSITTLLLFLPVSAFAQAAGGVAGISGTVRDASGAAVPNAKVVISSASQGQIRTITSNGSGVFTAPALIPGPGYQVTVTKPGFAPYDVKNIDLAVGQNVNLVAPLSVAGTATVVQVEGAQPLVDDTKTDVSQVIDTQQIDELPVNGRRYDNFVLLTPGVTNDGNFGLLTFRGVANGNPATVLALAYLIAGHELHHRKILEERYFPAIPRA